MKKFNLIFLLMSFMTFGFAQYVDENYYFSRDKLMDFGLIVPQYEDYGGFDQCEYEWVKSKYWNASSGTDDYKRKQQAITDNAGDFNQYITYTLNGEEYKIVYYFDDGTCKDPCTNGWNMQRKMRFMAGGGEQGIKNIKFRIRPFYYNNDMNNPNLPLPEASKYIWKTSSYVSGHTLQGAMIGFAFSQMYDNPAFIQELTKKIIEFGNSRVILGAHWRTDTTHAYIVACPMIAQLFATSKFRSDVDLCKTKLMTNSTFAYTRPAQDNSSYRWTDIDIGDLSIIRFKNPDNSYDIEMKNDKAVWNKYKGKTTSKRYIRASYELQNLSTASSVFDGYFWKKDFKITEANCPQLWKLLQWTRNTVNNILEVDGNLSERINPNGTASDYPSVNTIKSMCTAMILAGIDLDNQNTIYYRQRNFAMNEVVVGHAWASDINNAYVYAYVIMMHLYSSPSFKAQFNLAKSEMSKISR